MAITKRNNAENPTAPRRAAVARGSIRARKPFNTQPRAIALAVSAALLPWGHAHALPTGEQVVAGQVAISRPSSQNMQIDQASQKGIVNWQGFSIGASEHVNISQPSASAALLNRVLGNNPSEIFGRLTANGQVFLVNNAGVLFAPGASVNVGALFASSLSMSNEDFLSGRYVFSNSGNAGSVVNQGTIVTASGYTALVGPQVRNDGVIVARAGSVALAAGDRVSLDLIGDGLISINVDQAAVNASVVNTGSIEADGGRVLLTARSANALLDTVINSSGLIRANSLVERNGEIVLDGGSTGVVAVSGTLQAAGVDAGTTGGTIKVLGDKVGLVGSAVLNVSGDAGGGTVLVGGNFQGKGPEANASKAYVGSGTSISADAVTSGDGGKVIVWADDTTLFYGFITARGGAQGGNGGFVEVSGKKHLAFDGRVDVGAPAGSSGTILLDPDNITIVANTGGADDTEVTDNNAILFGDRATESLTISETAIEGLTGNIVLQAEVDITVNAGLTGGLTLNVGATSLVLQAGDDISVGSAITTANPAGTAIHLEADSPHATGGANGTGTITIAGTGPITSSNGAITLIAADFSIGAAVDAGSGAMSVARSVDGATLTIGTGQLTAAEINNLSTTGTLTIGQATTAGSNGLGTGLQQLTAGSIDVDTATTVNGATAGHFRVIADNGVTLTESLTTNQQTTINADFDNNGTGTLTVAVSRTLSTTDNTLSVTAADVDLNANSALDSGAAATSITASNNRSIDLGGTAGDLSLSNAELGRITAASLTLNTTGLTGDVTVDGVSDANSTNSGAITINAGGTVSFAGNASTFNKGVAVNANDGVAVARNITATTGNIALDGDANSTADGAEGISFTGTRTLTATAGSITLQNGAAGANGDIASEALNLLAANGVTVNDDLTATAGTLTVNADNDNNATGTFTVAVGKTVATASSGDIDVTAADIDLAGNLSSAGTVSITGSSGVNIGLGAAAGGLSLTDAELGRITTPGLTITSQGAGTITADALSSANTDQFGTLTLDSATTLTFSGGTSTIGNRLSGTGATGVAVNADLSANAADGDLTLTAAANSIAFGAGVTVTAGGTGTLTLDSATAMTGAGALTLNSGDHLTLDHSLTTNGATVINADANNDGTGTFTVAVSRTLSTTDNTLSVTAADVDLNANSALDSGAAATSITASNNRSIGLGAMAGDMTISGAELQNITATGLTLSGGNITVDNITAANSNNIDGTVTLNATNDNGSVSFINNASEFKALTVNADDGIVVNVGITTNTGALSLNGDFDNAADTNDNIQLASVTVSSAGGISLSATTGGIVLTGADASTVTLTSTGDGNAVTLNASVTDTNNPNLTISSQGDVSLAAVTLGTGTLLVTADSNNNDAGKTLTASGAISTGGVVTLSGGTDNDELINITQDVSAGGLLTIQNAATVDLAGNVDLSGTSVAANSNIGAINLSGAGTNLVTASAGSVNLGPVTDGAVVANLTVSATTDVTLAAVTMDGGGALSASADSDNNSTSTLQLNGVVAATGVTLSGGGTGTLDTIDINADVNAGAAALTIQNAATVDVADGLTLAGTGVTIAAPVQAINVTINAATGALTATDGGNNFTGTVNLTGGTTQITDANALTLGMLATGALTVNSTGALNLGQGTTGALVANSGGGDITQTGVLTTGTVSVTGANITLGSANVLGALTVNAGTGNVSITENDAISVATITHTGTLTLNAGANGITQTGDIEVGAGALGLTGGAITLANAANTFGAVTVNAGTGDVSLRQDGAMSIAGITHTGNLTLNANGAASDITQTGAIAIGAGTANLSGANITLGSANVLGAVTVNAGTGNVSITENDAISVATITHTGNLVLNAGANDITQTGTISVGAGTANLTGGNITLGSANVLGALTVNAGTGNVSITENDAINVASIAHTGNLALSAAGAITQTGAVTVSGTSNIAAGANAITLTNAGNDFGGAVAVSNSGANAVQLTDVNNVQLAASTVGGDLAVTANGGAGQITLTGGSYTTTSNGVVNLTGNTILGGDTTISTGSGNVTFGGTIDGNFSLTVNDSGTNTFMGTIGGATALANITTDAPGLSILNGNLTVTGAINLLDGITANNRVLTSTGGGGITMNNANNTSPATINTTGAVTLGGALIGSAGTPLQLTVTPDSLTMTQLTTAFFTGPAIPGSVIFPDGSSITYNNAIIAQSILQQQASSAVSSASQAVTAAIVEEANKTFGTDSVAEDVEYGFAGEIGATPPMDHRIDESGISLPRCVQEAREGLPCK